MRRLLKQTIYTLNDIKRNKFTFILGLLQIVISMILLCYIFQLSMTYNNTMKKLDTLTKDSEIYHIQLLAESAQIDLVLNDEEKVKDLDMLIQYIDKMPVEKYIINRTTDIYFDKETKPFSSIGSKIEDAVMIPGIKVTSNFFEIFDVKGDFEIKSVEQRFSDINSKDPVPVILGNDFRKYFEVGDTFNDDTLKYEVVGFLKKKEFIVVPYENDKAVYLDNSIIMPNAVETDSFSSLVSLCFITDDINYLKEVINKSNELNLWPLGYESFDFQIEEGRTDMLNEIMTMGVIMVILFIFASIGIISYIMRLISNRLMEFSIHMIYGASKEDILTRIFIQIFIILLISIAIAFTIFGISVEVLISSLMLLIYGVLILISPYKKLKHTSVVSILRSYAK